MTTQRAKEIGVNLNTIILIISIMGAIVTTVFFFAPLRTLPSDMSSVQRDVRQMQQTQHVQTESIKILAEVAQDSKAIRKEFDKHSIEDNSRHKVLDQEIQNVIRRLDRLESRP